MKPTIKTMIMITLMGSVMFLSNCGKDKTTEDSGPLGGLSGVWKFSAVTMDDVAQDGFSGFTLTLSGASGASSFQYSTSGRPVNSPWMASGTWTFGGTASSMITRDKGTADELPMTYIQNGNQLELDFQFSGSGYLNSRSNSVSGNWKFKLVKQ